MRGQQKGKENEKEKERKKKKRKISNYVSMESGERRGGALKMTLSGSQLDDTKFE